MRADGIIEDSRHRLGALFDVHAGRLGSAQGEARKANLDDQRIAAERRPSD
jgi:hypothetical protein